MDITVEIAGKRVLIRNMSQQLEPRFQKYLAKEDPDMELDHEIRLSLEEREKTARQIDRYAEQVQDPEASSSRFPGIYLEFLAIHRLLTKAFLEDDIYLFHASTLMIDGIGIAFTAPSGTGKSTHSRLWQKYIPGVKMVNDDKPFLRVSDDGKDVLVCGSPWNGKENRGSDIRCPLRAFFLIGRADTTLPAEEQNQVEEIPPIEAFRELYLQIYRPGVKLYMKQTMDFINKLMHCVKIYRLRVNMSPEAARTAYGVVKRDILGMQR